MQIGDLVTVRPANSGFYIIIKQLEGTSHVSPDGKDLWELWGPHTVGAVTMSEKWIDVISEGEKT